MSSSILHTPTSSISSLAPDSPQQQLNNGPVTPITDSEGYEHVSSGSGSLSFVFRISCSSSVGPVWRCVALRFASIYCAAALFSWLFLCAISPSFAISSALRGCMRFEDEAFVVLFGTSFAHGRPVACVYACLSLFGQSPEGSAFISPYKRRYSSFAPTETQHRRVRHPLRGSQQFDYDYDFIRGGRTHATKAQALSARQHRRAPRDAQRRRAPAARDAQLPLPRPRRAPPEPRVRAAPVQVRDRQLVDRAPPLCAAPARGGGARAKGGAEGVRGAEAGVQ